MLRNLIVLFRDLLCIYDGMSSLRRRYSEKSANKLDFLLLLIFFCRPVPGDNVRNKAFPLGRPRGEIIPDRPLTPEKQECPDKVRSYINPSKFLNTNEKL